MDALLKHEARRLVEQVDSTGGVPVVHVVRDDLSLDEARALAREITNGGAVAVVGVDAEKAQLIVARPAVHALDCGAVVRSVLAKFGGRGGGQAAVAQGGAPDRARLRDAVAQAVEEIRRG